MPQNNSDSTSLPAMTLRDIPEPKANARQITALVEEGGRITGCPLPDGRVLGKDEDKRFAPEVWPEDAMPEDASGYLNCEICTPRSRIVWGEGNPKAPVAVILDNPGAREDRDGHEYVCGTRQTLQDALHGAGLSADDVYITYLLKCRPLRAYDKEAVRAFSKPFLVRQIEAMQPEFIVCLGDTVVQAMFDDKDAHVKDLRRKWRTALGRPCLVSYHPLAVRRRPNLMRQFMEDWGMLAQRLRGDADNDRETPSRMNRPQAQRRTPQTPASTPVRR